MGLGGQEAEAGVRGMPKMRCLAKTPTVRLGTPKEQTQCNSAMKINLPLKQQQADFDFSALKKISSAEIINRFWRANTL